MRRMITLSLAMLLFCPLMARGQELSAEQQEVWQTVESYWQCFAEGDAECFLSHLHDDFSGWTHSHALPRDKGDMAQYLPLGFRTTETLIHDVDPVVIKVHGNFAIVHYYYTRTYGDASGEMHNDAGKWTDILMKQGNCWLMIADHGGSTASK